MKFLKVVYSMNQTYYVEDVAIHQMVKNILVKNDSFKLEDIKVKINSSHNGYALNVKITKKTKKSFYQLINKLENEIEEQSINLTNTKPENVAIFIKEEEKNE